MAAGPAGKADGGGAAAAAPIEIRALAADDRAWAAALLRERWGAALVVSRGREHRADELPGLVAWTPGGRAGLLTYRVAGPECEVVTLDALTPGRGTGTALLEAVRALAAGRGCRRLWLVTTNDNVPAQRFYARRGWRLAALHGDALSESRRLKPEIPLRGLDGAPLRDEPEYEQVLTDG